MRNKLIRSLLLPLFLSLSVSVSAAPSASTPVSPSTSEVSTSAVTLNLNTADSATLQKELSGIGKAKAEAIVAYREAHGAFQTVDELLEVKGIGSTLIERNRGKMTVQ
ncbi:ComEA family DNA-binding protein [Pseudomonas sp. K1(2024)]|uniref:Helix-hairpin-helix domain-containing protein n=2 Tax=Pseudomonas TaxID=286 RepID=A0AAI8PC23_9PSED|nr:MULTISPECIES: helix-hairpin-helix domain-containing protein [Pseudomonas]AIZ33592.1 competence protein ComEA [Pseudomonas parafulva]AXO89264.1 helix-hairpin-helix domain-containing protein [Pseudomonas parafulva]MDO7901314.1 helix-hairpin-helix domain-containing protein [Pseudomonas sp. K13]MDV9033943.1 helix-hairpin-helix domain-containing protein [Pseudomonas sp. RAC1]